MLASEFLVIFLYMFGNEFMLDGILGAHSFLWIFYQHIFNITYRLLWQMLRNLQFASVSFYYFLYRLLSAHIVKWSLSDQQLVT